MKTIGRFVFDNAISQPVTANGNIPLPTKTVNNNCVQCDGYNVTIDKCGTYLILANFTFPATATGTIETQMFRNGNAVPGAHAVDTATTIGNYYSQAFNALVTVNRNAQTTINFKALSATSVRVAEVIVVKVA